MPKITKYSFTLSSKTYKKKGHHFHKWGKIVKYIYHYDNDTLQVTIYLSQLPTSPPNPYIEGTTSNFQTIWYDFWPFLVEIFKKAKLA